MQMDERVWILLVKKKRGEATVSELAELDILLAKESSPGYSKEIIERLWDTPLASLPEMDMNENSWNRIQRRINSPAGKLVWLNTLSKKWMSAAAIILVGAASFFIFKEQLVQAPHAVVSPHTLNTISTRPASKTKIQLPDGTQVWLNANSQLVYNTENFGVKSREITLTGEAFFDVMHNAKAPFIIHAANVNITVKGTAFNVKAYPRQKNIVTTLVRGLIEITTTQDPARKIIVKPNEKIIISSENNTDIKPSNTDSSENSLYTISRLQKNEKQILSEAVWIRDKLEFDNETFNDLAPQFESWFSINIHFENEAIKQKRFTGLIEKETIQQTLEAMQLSSPFTYTIKGNDVWINIVKN